MYTTKNFPNKKALKEAVLAGEQIRVFQPNDMFGVNAKMRNANMDVCVEGPHYPQPHNWYAGVTLVDGIITKVR